MPNEEEGDTTGDVGAKYLRCLRNQDSLTLVKQRWVGDCGVSSFYAPKPNIE